jgi:hypothetical protein
VHQNESPEGLDQLAYVLAGRVIGSDGGTNRDPAILRDFRRDRVRLQYQLAAMRRIQMTRRSGQLREPPKFFGFGFTAFRFGVSRKELTFIARKCRAIAVLVIVL